MEQENLIIQLKPSYRATAQSLDYDLESGDFNDDTILFTQGFNIEELEVEPGEEFIINRNFESGSINCEEVKYEYKKQKNDDWDDDDDDRRDPDWISLSPGRYRFEEDSLTITKLSDNVDFEEDDEW